MVAGHPAQLVRKQMSFRFVGLILLLTRWFCTRGKKRWVVADSTFNPGQASQLLLRKAWEEEQKIHLHSRK